MTEWNEMAGNQLRVGISWFVRQVACTLLRLQERLERSSDEYHVDEVRNERGQGR